MLREQRIQHHIVLVLGIAENVGRGGSDGTELDNQRVPIEKKDDDDGSSMFLSHVSSRKFEMPVGSCFILSFKPTHTRARVFPAIVATILLAILLI